MVKHWLSERERRLALADGGQRRRRGPDRAWSCWSSCPRSSPTAPTSWSILVPLLVGMMLFIHRQYARSAAELAVRPDVVVNGRRCARSASSSRSRASTARSSRRSTSAARSTTTSAPSSSPMIPRRQPVRADFERQVPGVPLVVVESPYRALAGPLARLPRRARRGLAAGQAGADHLRGHPRVRRPSWWERVLYNQSAKRLRRLLLGRPHTVVVNVPYRRDSPVEPEEVGG